MNPWSMPPDVHRVSTIRPGASYDTRTQRHRDEDREKKDKKG